MAKRNLGCRLSSYATTRLWGLMLAATISFFIFGSSLVCAEPDDTGAQNLVGDLGITLEESLKAEQNNVQRYRERLKRAEREQIYLTAAANGYQLQLSTYGNLLLSTGVDVSLLQKTRAELKSSAVEIQKMTDEISPGGDTLALERENLEQQKQLVDKQISEIARINSKEKKNPSALALEKTARQLAVVLKEKEVLVSKLNKIYQKRLATLSEIETSFLTLDSQFDAAIEQRKTKDLFERNSDALRFDALKSLMKDMNLLFQRAGLAVEPEFWIRGGQKLWQSAGLVAVSFAIVLLAVFFILFRIKSFMSGVRDFTLIKRLGNWHRMAVGLLTLFIIPGGMAVAVLLYSRLDTMYLVSPALEVTAFLMLVYFFIKCVGCTLAENPFNKADWENNTRPAGRFVRWVAVFSLVYVPVYYILGHDSGVLVVFRMAGALSMFVWTIMTWRNQQPKNLHAATTPQDRKKVLMSLGIKYLLVMVSGVSLVIDMTGYGSLAVHWLVSWAQSIVIVLWWALLYALIQEWDQYYREKSSSERDEFLYDNYPVQWLMIRAGQLFWLVSLLAALLLTWGNQQTVLGRLYLVLAHPMTVGNMTFSLMGLIYAVLVLLITYALTRMWTWLFQSKFLSRSGMAMGLQDSITTITVYIIWMFGILISLHVFGLNTASLAVAFGALGIGLGFGLQNIFNNFISGIILLFERPIQVGDDVEVNGVWAQVKKINVRSTVVQTYDNASLIIPNADFISNQVTNWSFKDKRIRRSINVGVAYGSDVEQVRQTLLDIAENTPKVLRYPKPDVLFKDFGDSALIFRLRIWTDINNMLAVETDIRFRIDKLFRERGIEISFPQRDIHIRSVTDVLGAESGKDQNRKVSTIENED